MQPENFPFHISSIASTVADIIVGLMALRAYKQSKSKAWAFLSFACALFLIGSLYGYLYGLAEIDLIRWPLNDIDSLRAYYITSFISVASQMCFVTSIAMLYKDFHTKS